MNNTNKRISNLNKRIDQILKSRKTITRQRPNSAPVANGATSSSRNQASANKYSVRQTERILTVIADGAQTYHVDSRSINPGISFPWLANIAKGYDKYHLKNLRFTFKTSQPTLTAGTVGLGFDYNPLDSSPNSSTEFSQLTTWNIQSVWKNFSLSVDTSRQLWNYLYVRTNLPGGTDLKTYDIGKLHIMFEGLPNTVTSGTIIGYVEVTYNVDLIDKQPIATLSSFTQGLVSVGTNFGTSTGTISSGAVAVVSAPKKWLVNNLDLETSRASSSTYGTGSTFTAAVANYLSLSTYPVILDAGLYNVDISFATVANLTVNGLVDVDGNDLIHASGNNITGTIVVEDGSKAIYVKATATGSVTMSNFINSLKCSIQKI